MSPVTAVVLIAAIAFLFGVAAPVVFGRPEEERAPATLLDWLVRGLVGAAFAHTALAVYEVVEQARQSAGDNLTRVLLSETVMDIFAFGGILLGLAALLHLLGRRIAEPPAR